MSLRDYHYFVCGPDDMMDAVGKRSEENGAMEHYVEELVEALASEDGMKRKQARETLVLVGDPAIEPVRDLIASREKRVRWEAAKTLAAMVDPPSVEIFVGLLDDPLPDLRWIAGDGLINLGPRTTQAVLQSLLRSPLSKGRRQGAHRVLRGLSAENQVLSDIVGPVIDALATETDSQSVVATRAGRALSNLDRVTGRLPRLDG